jgi:hypothetical protein
MENGENQHGDDESFHVCSGLTLQISDQAPRVRNMNQRRHRRVR